MGNKDKFVLRLTADKKGIIVHEGRSFDKFDINVEVDKLINQSLMEQMAAQLVCFVAKNAMSTEGLEGSIERITRQAFQLITGGKGPI